MSDLERQPGTFERMGRKIDEYMVSAPRFDLDRIDRFVSQIPYKGRVALTILIGLPATLVVLPFGDSPQDRSTIAISGVAITVGGALLVGMYSKLRHRS